MTAPTARLVLDGVSMHFGGLRAVDRVSLTLAAGDRHAVIGPNGAGKTTLFNLISGELLPTEGRVILSGGDVTRLPPHRRAARGIARTFQITRLFPKLTVIENALLASEALDPSKFTMYRPVSRCAPLVERAAGLLDRFGLWSSRDEVVRNLAYGDQRKLEVALSMAGRPQLLLLDEPMAGLSYGERDGMLSLLDSLDRDITVLLIEHDMDVALSFAANVTVLEHGRVLAHGPKGDIAANPRVQEIYLGC
jgi:branched-chain amino acid transport system ATP-binding protein